MGAEGSQAAVVVARWPTRGVAAVCAITAAVAGAVEVVSLILFYALEVTKPLPHLFGPTSDLTSALLYALQIPVVLWLTRSFARSRGDLIVAWIVVAISAVTVVTTVLLVVHVLGFVVATSITLVCIVAQAGWLIWAGRRLWRSPGIRLAARFGFAGGVCLLAGMVLVAAAFLLPEGWPRVTGWIVGGIPGFLGWTSIPVWFALLGRALLGRTFSAPGVD